MRILFWRGKDKPLFKFNFPDFGLSDEEVDYILQHGERRETSEAKQ